MLVLSTTADTAGTLIVAAVSNGSSLNSPVSGSVPPTYVRIYDVEVNRVMTLWYISTIFRELCERNCFTELMIGVVTWPLNGMSLSLSYKIHSIDELWVVRLNSSNNI